MRRSGDRDGKGGDGDDWNSYVHPRFERPGREEDITDKLEAVSLAAMAPAA